MTAFTWTSLQTAVATALVQYTGVSTFAPDFTTLLPSATSYAEGRITRELVLLATRAVDVSLSTAAGKNTVSLAGMATAGLSVVEHVVLMVSGVPWSFDMASHDFIDLIWPDPSVTMNPSAADWIGRYWGMFDDHTVLLAPSPDAVYQVQITGLFTPTPISASNPSTYISKNYGDLMFAAVMVWLSGGLLRNYGSQSDDPKMAMSYEAIFQSLLGPAKAEERRRRGLAQDETPTAQEKA